jgi:hypothetical protein
MIEALCQCREIEHSSSEFTRALLDECLSSDDTLEMIHNITDAIS